MSDKSPDGSLHTSTNGTPPTTPPKEPDPPQTGDTSSPENGSPERRRKDSLNGQPGAQGARVNHKSRSSQGGSVAKRLKLSSESEDDDECVSRQKAKKVSDTSQTSDQPSSESDASEGGASCLATRFTRRESRRPGAPHSPPPAPPPRSLQLQCSVTETQQGRERTEIVTPDSKPVTPNNGQLAIGVQAVAVIPHQPHVNNNAMLDNNGMPQGQNV